MLVLRIRASKTKAVLSYQKKSNQVPIKYVWVAQFEKGPEASYLLEVKLYVEFLVSLFSNLSGLQARTAGANLFGVRHWIVEL